MPTAKIKPTKTADKMLSIICGFFNLNKSILENEDPNKLTWESLNISIKNKEYILERIACHFCIPIGPKIKVNFPNEKNKHISDFWPAQFEKIKTIWNVLQFIEANDDFNGKPAAYNLD